MCVHGAKGGHPSLDICQLIRCNAGPELAGNPRVARRPVNPMHSSIRPCFYSPRAWRQTLLDAKHAWRVPHSVGAHHCRPRAEIESTRGGVVHAGGFVVPGLSTYRLPLNPERWRTCAGAEPSILEAGMPFIRLGARLM